MTNYLPIVVGTDLLIVNHGDIGTLSITESAGYSTTGNEGGSSYLPASATYTLNNTGDTVLSWTATKTVSWLSISPTSGTLTGGASTTVTVSVVTAQADLLTDGGYVDTITFSNTTSGTGDTTRSASISVVSVGPPTLVPGTGFSGTTATPSQVGNSGAAGYSESPAARWNTVPFQDVSGTLHIGVKAFHIEGIDYVSFSADDGAWIDVQTASVNPNTGYTEYVAKINAALFDDGLIEVRAIVYPVNGQPLVLQGVHSNSDSECSLWLNTNADATLPNLVRYVSTSGSSGNDGLTSGTPKATIMQALLTVKAAQGNCDGAIIYLLAGSHQVVGAESSEAPTTVNRWIRITRAPGLAKGDVTFTGTVANGSGNNEGLKSQLIKMYGINATGVLTGTAFLSNDSIWYDDVAFTGPGRTAGVGLYENQFNIKYVTNCTITDVQDLIDGVKIWQGCDCDTIAQSAFHNCTLVVDCSLVDTDRGADTSLHADVYQFTSARRNRIVDGLTAVTDINGTGIRMQTAAGSPMRDIAIVNVTMTMASPNNGGVYLWEMEDEARHMLIKDCIFSGGFVYSETAPKTFEATNVVFDGCTFTDTPDARSGVTIR